VHLVDVRISDIGDLEGAEIGADRALDDAPVFRLGALLDRVLREEAVAQLVDGRRFAFGDALAERVVAAVDLLPEPFGFGTRRGDGPGGVSVDRQPALAGADDLVEDERPEDADTKAADPIGAAIVGNLGSLFRHRQLTHLAVGQPAAARVGLENIYGRRLTD
jgi:hypothetical protein